MKVEIAYTLEIDAEQWADEFGLETSEVRADVQQYLTRIGYEFVTAQLGLTANLV